MKHFAALLLTVLVGLTSATEAQTIRWENSSQYRYNGRLYNLCNPPDNCSMCMKALAARSLSQPVSSASSSSWSSSWSVVPANQPVVQSSGYWVTQKVCRNGRCTTEQVWVSTMPATPVSTVSPVHRPAVSKPVVEDAPQPPQQMEPIELAVTYDPDNYCQPCENFKADLKAGKVSGFDVWEATNTEKLRAYPAFRFRVGGEWKIVYGYDRKTTLKEIREAVRDGQGEPLASASTRAGSYESTPPAVVDDLLNHWRLKPSDVVVDVGCGPEAAVILAAAEQSGAMAIGIEIDREAYRDAAAAVLAAERAGRIWPGQVRVIYGDARDVDLRELGATHVYAYLWQETLEEMVPTLQESGAIVVSGMHEIPGAEGGWVAGDLWQMRMR